MRLGRSSGPAARGQAMVFLAHDGGRPAKSATIGRANLAQPQGTPPPSRLRAGENPAASNASHLGTYRTRCLCVGKGPGSRKVAVRNRSACCSRVCAVMRSRLRPETRAIKVERARFGRPFRTCSSGGFCAVTLPICVGEPALEAAGRLLFPTQRYAGNAKRRCAIGTTALGVFVKSPKQSAPRRCTPCPLQASASSRRSWTLSARGCTVGPWWWFICAPAREAEYRKARPTFETAR
jgi:hypothetical protein